MTNTFASYPSHYINPKLKDDKWIKEYIEAAWRESERGDKSFYAQSDKFHTILQYARGKQDIKQYLRTIGIDENEDESWLKIDLSVLPTIPRFRRQALGKLNKIDYNILATPIDQLAKDEQEKYFAKIRAKVMLREGLKQKNPQLAEMPVLKKQPGEPDDLEELEMQSKFTNKHNQALEAETAIDVVLNENRYKETSKLVKQDFFDFGAACVKEYLDHNDRIKIKRVPLYRLITNECEERDFSDLTHIGEVEDMTIGELKNATKDTFSTEEWKQISQQCLGKFGNGRSYPRGRSNSAIEDSLKVRVVHMEIMSINNIVFQKRTDKYGNEVFRRTKWKQSPEESKGYKTKGVSVIYKGSWIVDTPFVYNAGLKENMIRKKGDYEGTSFSYYMYASDFYNMEALGIMEQLIPLADSIQISWYKLQNAIAEARPKGVAIDFSSIESIPLGEGGEVMNPEDVVDMFLQKGVLVYRRVDPRTNEYNQAKPIEEIENGVGRDAVFFYDKIARDLQMMRDIAGLNGLTDGSTPDARTLTTVANMAYEGTENALSYIVDGDIEILEKISNCVVLRIQDLIKSGKNVTGYRKALGANSMEFWKASERLSAHLFGIKIEVRPDGMARQRLLDYMTKYSGESGLMPDDIFLIENTDNLKQAQQIVAYRVGKRQREIREHQLRVQQENANGNKEVARATEQAKQQTFVVETNEKIRHEEVKTNGSLALENLKHQNRMRELELIAEKEATLKGVELGEKMRMEARGQ